MKYLRKRLSVLGEKEAERYAKYNTVFEDEYHNDLRAHKAGFQKLSGIVVELATCWDDIPPLVAGDCDKEKFYQRLYDDRMKRVEKYKEALRSLETFLGEGENNG